MQVKYFDSAPRFRAWLERHHADIAELWVGYYKKGTGRRSITHGEAVDQALCFGWIDGLRRSVDALRYTNRFTPRKPRSNWSAVNLRRVRQLKKEGLMAPAGLPSLVRRDKSRSQPTGARARGLSPKLAPQMRSHEKAWSFFRAQAPWYQRTAAYWVESAKREETRQRRLAQLVRDSARGRRLNQLTPPARRSGTRTRAAHA